MRLETVDYNELMWVSSAKENEVETIVDLISFLAKEERFFNYIPSNVNDVIKNLIKEDTVLVLRSENGHIVGLLAFAIFNNPNLVFKKAIAQELVWCVKKEYRKYSFMLLDMYESKVKDRGCTHTVLAVNEDHKKSKALKKLYELKGYKVLETMYEKELV